jgi:type III secretory pathway component EscV/tetratricopeptide (TPR) repeat protein
MSEPFDIREFLDVSRSKVAAADMPTANEALDRILSAGSTGLFGLWDAIDEQIGKAEAPGLRERLIELRARFVDRVVAREAARIEKVFRRSPDEGWNAWLLTLAESISDFRHELSTKLCAYPFPFQGRKDQATGMAKAVRCMYQDRWPEAYDQLEQLTGKEFLSTATRAKLLVILGQIQLYQFRKTGPARELFNAAEAMAPGEVRVVCAMGDYWVLERDLQKAESYYRRAIEVAPRAGCGYVGMGDACEHRNELEQAESWYQKAIASASGESPGYDRLIRLYGRPELLEKHEADLFSLTEKAIAVGPDGEYRRYIALGDIYAQNKQFEKARRWYEKAIALDDRNPEGYVSVGMYYEKLGSREEAETNYKKAIEVAPECYEGYWALTWFYEQQYRWQDALEWYKKAPLHRREWVGLARAKVGEMHDKIGNRPEAEDILKHELRVDKDNQTAKDVLLEIAEDWYSTRGDREAAIRLYAEIYEILGDSYEGDHHNGLGNLNYYYGESEKAAAEYRRAIAARPDDAVFHRNLATAYSALKHYEQAVQELEKARQLDNDTDKFNSEMALLANAEGNDYFTRRDYRKAVDLYTKAIEHDRTDDVFHANLGRAWEQIRGPAEGIQPLDKASDAYRAAQGIKPTNEYAQAIERLRRRRELVSSYGEKAIDWLHVVTPVAIEVARDLIPHVEGSTRGSLADKLAKDIADMRKGIEDRFGVRIPGLRFRGSEVDLPDGTYTVMLMEIPLVSGKVALDQRFCAGTAQALSAVGVTGKEALNPLTGDAGFWIARQDWQRVEAAELELWPVMKYLVMHLEAVIRRNLAEFVGHDEVARLLEATSFQKLEELRNHPEKHSALTNTCRALVAEEVPIRQFDAIYEAFDRGWSERVAPRNIVETIRALPVLSPELPGNGPEYTVLSLGPRYETEMRHAIHRSGSHAVLAMEPEKCQDALSALRNKIGNDRHLALMVHDPELRPLVRRLMEFEFFNIPVLSRRELRSDSAIDTARLVELDDGPTPAKPIRKSRARVEVSAAGLKGVTIDDVPGPGEIDITVFVSSAFSADRSSADDQPIDSMFSLMRDGLFYELGIVLPEVKLEVDSNLETAALRFSLNGRQYPPIRGLEPDEILVNDTVARLSLLNINGREAINPANGGECAIVREKNTLSKTWQEAGLTTWGPAGFLVLALSAAIRKSAAAFQTADITQTILESLRPTFPELIDTALKRFTVEQLCLALRSLLDEEISIRDMRSILESMLAINGTIDVDLSRYIVLTSYVDQLCPVAPGTTYSGLAISDYSNFVRASLKRYISHKYTRGGNTLAAYLLDTKIERRIGEAATRPLADEEKDRLRRAVNEELGNLPPTAQNPVLLTTTDIRRTLRNLLEADFPNLAVVSYQELSPDLNIQSLARISWEK